MKVGQDFVNKVMFTAVFATIPSKKEGPLLALEKKILVLMDSIFSKISTSYLKKKTEFANKVLTSWENMEETTKFESLTPEKQNELKEKRLKEITASLERFNKEFSKIKEGMEIKSVSDTDKRAKMEKNQQIIKEHMKDYSVAKNALRDVKKEIDALPKPASNLFSPEDAKDPKIQQAVDDINSLLGSIELEEVDEKISEREREQGATFSELKANLEQITKKMGGTEAEGI